LKRLSDLGDQLEAFQKAVYFEMFRADLVRALGYTSEPRELQAYFGRLMKRRQLRRRKPHHAVLDRRPTERC
jgi:hypothetical protein